MQRSLTLMAAMFASATLLLAGCSQQSSQQSSDSNEAASPSSSNNSQSAEAEATEEDENLVEDTRGPLEIRMGPLWGQDLDDEAELELNRRMQELIAQCMNDQGFDYYPVLPEEDSEYQKALDELPKYGTLEWAERYGFGLVHDDYEDLPENTIVDPNLEYRDSLSDSDQMAYDAALEGREMTVEEIDAVQTGEIESTPEMKGCRFLAMDQVGNDDESPQDDPEFAELYQAINTMWETAGEDPELQKIQADWSECLLKAGYPGYASREDFHNAAYEEYSKLELGSDGNPRTPSDEEREQFYLSEVEMAVADIKCSEEIRWDERLREIEFRAQQGIVDQYGDQIDAMVAKWGNQ